MSPENARALGDAPQNPPIVVANSMREVQPEINLLVSPLKERLFAVPPPGGAPVWEVVEAWLKAQKTIGPRKLNVPEVLNAKGNPGMA